MYHLSLVNALLLILILGFLWMMYRFNRASGNTYNTIDILMGPGNRASLTNHILLMFGLLSVWVVIDRELDGKDDVSTILLGVLGVFVTKQTAQAITEALNKPTESSETTETTEKKTKVVVPTGPAANTGRKPLRVQVANKGPIATREVPRKPKAKPQRKRGK